MGKSRSSVQKLLFVKLSVRGLKPGTHLFNIKIPLLKIHGKPKILRKSLSVRK